jgi:predicted HNH restriction endonuclease
VKEHDIVVANNGYNRVVGVGVVRSGYFAPDDSDNPMRDDETTHRHHVRRVDWLICEAVKLPGKRFFVQSTLWPLDEGVCNKIKQVYRRKYSNDRTLLAKVDRLFPGIVASENTASRLPEEVNEDATFSEGSVQRILVNRYERDPKARLACVKHHKPICAICGFNFGQFYGAAVEGLIHVHHLKPLSEVRGEYIVDPVEDLRPVCPNCHAVLHSRLPPYSIEEVCEMLKMCRPVGAS